MEANAFPKFLWLRQAGTAAAALALLLCLAAPSTAADVWEKKLILTGFNYTIRNLTVYEYAGAYETHFTCEADFPRYALCKVTPSPDSNTYSIVETGLYAPFVSSTIWKGCRLVAFEKDYTSRLLQMCDTGSVYRRAIQISRPAVHPLVKAYADTVYTMYSDYYDLHNINAGYVLKLAKLVDDNLSIENIAQGDVYTFDYAIDSHGVIHVICSFSPGKTLYATNKSGAWVTTQIASFSSQTVSIALDRNDTPHITYSIGNMTVNTGLFYAKYVNNAWSSQNIDSSAPVTDTKIVFNNTSEPYIFYVALVKPNPLASPSSVLKVMKNCSADSVHTVYSGARDFFPYVSASGQVSVTYTDGWNMWRSTIKKPKPTPTLGHIFINTLLNP